MKKLIILLLMICFCGVSLAAIVNPGFESPAGVPTPNLEASFALTGWGFHTLGGVGTAAHTQLGGVVPSEGSQAAAIHNDYDEFVYQGLYQDIYGGFTDGQVVDVTFDLAIGETSGQGMPAVSVWFAELISDGAGGLSGFGAYNLIWNDWVADDGLWHDKASSASAATVTVNNFGTAAGQVTGYRLEFRPYAWNLLAEDIPGNAADAYAYVLVDNVVVTEPATMALLGLGGMLLRRKRTA